MRRGEVRPIEAGPLALREFDAGDLESLFDLYSRPETSAFESRDAHQTIDDSRSLLDYWLARRSDTLRTDYTLAIDSSGDLVGLCGLVLGFGMESPDPRTGFAAYRIHPSHWNQGYATRALVCLLEFAFKQLDLHRVHSGCAVSNVASIRVLEKAGLVREGTTGRSFPVGAKWHDYALFGVLAEEWCAMGIDADQPNENCTRRSAVAARR